MSRFNQSAQRIILIAAMTLLLTTPSKAEIQTYDCGYGDTYRIDTITHQFTCLKNGAIQNCGSAFIDGVYYYGLVPGHYPHRFFLS